MHAHVCKDVYGVCVCVRVCVWSFSASCLGQALLCYLQTGDSQPQERERIPTVRVGQGGNKPEGSKCPC